MKIFLLLSLIKKIKFTIKKKKIIIFDGVSLQDLEFVLKNQSYFVLEDRKERIKSVYINFSIIKNFLSNLNLLKKFSIKIVYTISLIEYINPKIIITSIDNSTSFYYCSFILHKKYFFLAIQNANRASFEDLKKWIKTKYLEDGYLKKIFIPNYVCFGQLEEDAAKKNKLKIHNFYKYGSIRTSNFLQYVKDNNIKLNKKLFDICYVCEAIDNADNIYNTNINEKLIDLLKLTINYAVNNNSKIIIVPRSYKKNNAYKSELNLYKKFLNNKEFKFFLSNLLLKKNKFSSYTSLFQSDLAIGCQSTLLIEKFALKEKILSCNFTSFNFLNFPSKGICSMNYLNQNSFNSRVTKILSLSNEEYFSKVQIKTNYIVNFDKEKSLIDKVRELIKNKIK